MLQRQQRQNVADHEPRVGFQRQLRQPREPLPLPTDRCPSHLDGPARPRLCHHVTRSCRPRVVTTVRRWGPVSRIPGRSRVVASVLWRRPVSRTPGRPRVVAPVRWRRPVSCIPVRSMVAAPVRWGRPVSGIHVLPSCRPVTGIPLPASRRPGCSRMFYVQPCGDVRLRLVPQLNEA